MTEWRVIPGHSMFEVSDDGRVRRIAYRDKRGPHRPLPAPLATRTDKAGYVLASVASDAGTGRQKWISLHRLVALAFHGPAPRGRSVCCHKDDNKNNNQPANLYWGTHKSNGEDARRNGAFDRRRLTGTHPKTHLTHDDVRAIRARFDTGEKRTAIAEDYAVGPTTVTMIGTRRNWGWLQ